MTITASIGFGNDISGEAVVFPMRELGSRDVTMDLASKILILQAPVNREFLEKARFVGALGVVVPSIHFRDYEYFKGNSDFAMMVLSRFGNDLAQKDVLERVSKLHGKTVKLTDSGKKLEANEH